jgi:para-aminobenzoate synthetase component 1
MPPAAPRACADRRRECARIEWRLGDPGDPAVLVEDFLVELGLPVRDLSGRRPAAAGHAATDPAADRLCGAALLVSAGGAAAIAGARAAAPTPAPAVPDVVAIGYAHDTRPPAEPPLVEPSRVEPARGGGWWLDRWEPSWTPQQHAAAVGRVRAAIAAGDVYQVNIVGHASARYCGDPAGALRRVAALAGARYGGTLAGPGWALACASPETLVDIRGGGRCLTRPIKGTRPATAAGRAELLGSAKERAEHIMIVDLERNDLARVAVTGSVRVDELYALRRWCDLWQAESTVSARLRAGVGLADLLRALGPGGSVTGAPKLAALDVIAALEPVGRGPSMGVLGWIGADRLDLGLAIRTVAVDADRVHVWAGGGIVWDSDPVAEVAEAAAKAAPLRAALAGG